MTFSEISAFLSTSPVFGVMTAEARNALARSARQYHCRGRTILHGAGSPATHVYGVVSGRIELTAVSKDGVEIAAGSFGARQWATWLAPFDGRPTERDMHAVHGSRILAFPIKLVRQLFEQNPAAYPYLLREISKRFRAILRLQDAPRASTRDQRVGEILLMLAEHDDAAKSAYAHVTRSELAARTSMSRQTLYEVLLRLEQRKLIHSQYRVIEIPDASALRLFCRD